METKVRLFEMCRGGEHSTCEGVFEVPGSRPRSPDNPRGVLRHECSCDCHQAAAASAGGKPQAQVKPGSQ
jgi:hypothetical protein